MGPNIKWPLLSSRKYTWSTVLGQLDEKRSVSCTSAHNIIHPFSTDTASHTVSSSTSPKTPSTSLQNPNRVWATYLGLITLSTIQFSDDTVPLLMSCHNFDPPSRQQRQGPSFCYIAYFGDKGGVTMCSVESVRGRISLTNILS